MQVSSETPFVPSIVLDQIVERKLNALSEGNQKAELMQERLEKAEWVNSSTLAVHRRLMSF
jgi:hypothetical protein